MNILIVNDDGINSEAMWILRDFASLLTTNIYIVAPNSDYSGYSFMKNSLRSKVKVNQLSETTFAVDGSPVDAVIFAFEYLSASKGIPFDIVLSGINTMINVADSTIFSSGTFAAAYTASSVYEVPSLSISLNRRPWIEEEAAIPPNYTTAARVAIEFAKTVLEQNLPKVCYNIIVPNIKYDLIKDVRITPFIPGTYFEAAFDIEDDKVVMFSCKKKSTVSIDNDSVYITPIAIDVTDYESFKKLIGEDENGELHIHETPKS